MLWNGSGATNTRFYFEHLGNGEYRIRTGLSNRYLEVRNSSTADGAHVAIWDWANINTQKWRLIRHSDFWLLENVNSGKVLDVQGNQNFCGAQTNQWTRNNTNAQFFRIIPA